MYCRHSQWISFIWSWLFESTWFIYPKFVCTQNISICMMKPQQQKQQQKLLTRRRKTAFNSESSKYIKCQPVNPPQKLLLFYNILKVRQSEKKKYWNGICFNVLFIIIIIQSWLHVIVCHVFHSVYSSKKKC